MRRSNPLNVSFGESDGQRGRIHNDSILSPGNLNVSFQRDNRANQIPRAPPSINNSSFNDSLITEEYIPPQALRKKELPRIIEVNENQRMTPNHQESPFVNQANSNFSNSNNPQLEHQRLNINNSFQSSRNSIGIRGSGLQANTVTRKPMFAPKSSENNEAYSRQENSLRLSSENNQSFRILDELNDPNSPIRDAPRGRFSQRILNDFDNRSEDLNDSLSVISEPERLQQRIKLNSQEQEVRNILDSRGIAPGMLPHNRTSVKSNNPNISFVNKDPAQENTIGLLIDVITTYLDSVGLSFRRVLLNAGYRLENQRQLADLSQNVCDDVTLQEIEQTMRKNDVTNLAIFAGLIIILCYLFM